MPVRHFHKFKLLDVKNFADFLNFICLNLPNLSHLQKNLNKNCRISKNQRIFQIFSIVNKQIYVHCYVMFFLSKSFKVLNLYTCKKNLNSLKIGYPILSKLVWSPQIQEIFGKLNLALNSEGRAINPSISVNGNFNSKIFLAS